MASATTTPAHTAATSTDWSGIIDTAGTSSSGSGSVSSSTSRISSSISSSSVSISSSSMTSAAAMRKRTLTNFSTNSSSDQQQQHHHPSTSSSTTDAPAHSIADAPSKSTKSLSSASSASLRSGRSAKPLSTKEYYDRCRKVADARVEDMVRRHYTFRTDDACRVDSTRWKLLKAKNHMACYRKLGKSGHGHVPDVLATGGVPGALDDVLHGVVNLSTEAMQIENAYASGDMVDTRVLATLVAPSVHEPFRTLTIKWVLRNHEELSRHRDYVYLEATGVTTAPDGERVGYHLVHSVALPSAPAFTKDANIIRGELSACYVYRQHPAQQQSVEVFYVGNVNPQGNTRARAALVIAVDAVLATAHSVQQCAMMKKLAYSLRTQAPPQTRAPAPQTRSRKNTLTSFMRSNAYATSNGTDDKHACGVCRRSLRFFGKGACALCASVVCGRCRVTKKLFQVDHGVFNPVKMDFCTECIVATNAMSATWVAARELELASLHDDVFAVRESHAFPSPRSSGRATATTRQRTATSDASDQSGGTNDERYTMASDYSSSMMLHSTAFDRSSRIWMPSDRVLRPTADILAPIRTEEPEDDDENHMPAFFADEDEACPIVEMPSDDESDDTGNGIGRVNHAVDLVVLYKP